MREIVKKLKNIHRPYIIVGVVLFILIIGYVAGYRINSDLSFGRVGMVVLNIPYKDTTIFINDDRKITTTNDGEKVIEKLSPTEHRIIVSLSGYYPWAKQIKIPSNGTVEFTPMFVPQNPYGYIVGATDPEYNQIKKSIAQNKTPEEKSPKVSIDGKTTAWVKDNTIFVKNEDKIFEVVKPETPIRNVEFYKNRSDAIIFSSGDGVYAIEVEKNGIQNFMPVYKGEKPVFIFGDENYVYIQDNLLLMQVVI